MLARRARGRLGAAVLLVAVVATTAGAQPVPSPQGELRIGVPELPGTIDPASAVEGSVPLVARQVFDTLVAYSDSSTDVEPALATHWAVSRSGLVWSFVLREGVTFHDGTTLTAAHVAASLERHLGADVPQPAPVWAPLLRGAPGVVSEVRATDARTVQVSLLQPYAPLLTALAHPGFGIVRPVTAPDGSVRLVGTGPYRIVEASPGRLVLDAVPTHWAGAPRTDRLVFLEVASDEHAEAEFDAGALDVWFPGRPPRGTEWALSRPGLDVGYLAFQTEKEPFSRRKIRQAVAAAIDPARLGAALGRAAVPLQSFLPTGVWARREGSPILGGTRRTVATLLREGGWPEGFVPALLAANDDPSIDAPRLAEALVGMFERAGIPMRLRLEPEAEVRAVRAAGAHDLVLADARVTAGDPHLFLYPLSTSEGASKGPEALNFSFYRNPRLDDMLIRGSQLAYRPERERLYQRAQAVLAEELPWIPIYVRLEWAVARPDVQELRLHPTGFPRLTRIGR